MTPVEILRAARKRIEEPERWCQKAYHDGDKCCAYAALGEVSDQCDSGAWDRIIVALHRVCNGPLYQFNDTHTHAEVLATFDRAIGSLS